MKPAAKSSLVALVVLLIFVGGGAVMWRRQTVLIRKTEAQAEHQRREFEKSLAEAKKTLAQSQAVSGHFAMITGAYDAPAILFAQSNVTSPSDFARWNAEWYLEWIKNHGPVEPRAIDLPQPEQPVRLSESGQFLAVVDGMRIAVYDTDTAKPIFINLAGGAPFDVAFSGSPESLRVLHGVPSGIELVEFDPRTGKRTFSHSVMGNMARIPAWSRDLSRAWIVENGAATNSLAVAATRDANDAVRIDLSGDVQMAVFSSDGSRVAATTADKKVSILETGTLKMSRQITPADWPVQFLSLSHGGRYVAWVQGDRTLHIQDVANGTEVTPPSEFDSDVNAVAFDSSGRWVFVHCSDKAWIVDCQKPRPAPSQLGGNVAVAGPVTICKIAGSEFGYLVDLDNGMEIGSPLGPLFKPATILQFAGKQALLRQNGKLLLWPVGFNDNPSQAPEQLLNDATRIAKLHVTANQDVEPLSPSTKP